MEIGGYRIDAVIDGEGSVGREDVFPEITAAQWAAHRGILDGEGRVRMAVGGFLLRGHGRIVLVDLGYGPGSLGVIPTGGMLDSLRSLGVTTSEVTDVFFTHLHRDHVGWASVDGVPQFPNATLRCGAADYSYFVAERHQADVADRLRPCENQFEAFDESRPPPGITVEPAPGHTPGTRVVILAGGGRRVALVGDVLHCPVQLIEPAWNTAYDLDPALARRTRERVLRDLEGGGAAEVAGGHFPGMRFGRLLATERRRQWVV